MMENLTQNAAMFHGKTVVVETQQKQTFVGRCSRVEDGMLIMVDLDHLHGLNTDDENVAYLDKALNMGHWPVIKKVYIPEGDVTKMDLLVNKSWLN
ncbi:MAG: hypothetical protein ACYTDT_00900 [Planctomycetota bacterium]|jgi:hypothetical protein